MFARRPPAVRLRYGSEQPGGPGTSVPAALSAVSCSNASITESGSDNCTVTLTAAPGIGGLMCAWRAACGGCGAGHARSSGECDQRRIHGDCVVGYDAQAVTLTASAGSISKSFALQLSAAVQVRS